MIESISGLKSSASGQNMWGTWPDYFPSFMRIPLDHVLVSNQINVFSKALNIILIKQMK